MTNSNSYLILYLIIILILLYAITFMSGYTCNVQTQPLDTFKSKEGGLTSKSIFKWLKEDNIKEYNELFQLF